MRLLLVEDGSPLGEGVQDGLQQPGYQVEWLKSGTQALHVFECNYRYI